MDFATSISEPIWKHYLSRHRLQKKDPAAAISDPVQPIVYYVDRGAPEPVRSALIEGASWWNQAFEAAGYRNAFRVEVMPPDVDPMDVRYNVIQWVHRSTRWAGRMAHRSTIRAPAKSFKAVCRSARCVIGRIFSSPQVCWRRMAKTKPSSTSSCSKW
jgi:hypothetical protein